jgi:hypothetical protein
MGSTLGNFARWGLAVLVLAAAAYLLLKVVVGLVASVVWVLVAAVAVIAIVWAIRAL